MKHLIVRCIRDRDWRCRVGGTLALALLIAVAIYGRIVRSGAHTPIRLVVYAFSTQEEVLTESIFPAFESWGLPRRRVGTGMKHSRERI